MLCGPTCAARSRSRTRRACIERASRAVGHAVLPRRWPRRGARDFKLKLAQSLAVGEPCIDLARRADAGSGPVLSFCGPVLGEARGAVLEAAEAIAGAGNVAAFGRGGSALVLAQEVQHRLFCYGVRIAATADPYLMRMTASTLRPGTL